LGDVLKRLALAALAPSSLIRQPPDWEGNNPPGTIPGLSGVARAVPWDAFASAPAPLLEGDAVHFVVREDGDIVAREPVPDEALDPLADAVTEQLGPPFVAVAVRDEDDVWAAAANEAEIVDLPDARGDELEVSSVGGVVTTRADGADSEFRYRTLEEILHWQGGDASLVAHRFVGTIFVVELFPL
jgi:hypothetical protein